MININLVSRVSKKEEGLKRLLFVLSFLSVLLVVGVFYLHNEMSVRALDLENKLKLAEMEYTEVESKMKRLKKFETLKANLSKKLEIINELKEKQTGPVKMLDLLSLSVPGEVWVTHIKNSGNLTVKGISFSNPSIADFMERLASAKGFKNIKLLQSVQRTVAARKVKEFQIVSDVDYQFLKDFRNVLSGRALPIPLKMLRKKNMKVPGKFGLVARAVQVER